MKRIISLMLTVLLVTGICASPANAYAEGTELRISFREEIEEIKDENGNTAFTNSRTVVTVSGGTGNAAKRITSFISNWSDERWENLRDICRDEYNMEAGLTCEGLGVSYSTTLYSQTDHFISFRIATSGSVSGRGSGNWDIDYFLNFDVKTGEILDLNDISAEPEKLLGAAKKYIIQDYINTGYSEALISEWRDIVEKYDFKSGSWGLKNSCISFEIPSDTIATYNAVETKWVDVPLVLLEQYLKKDYWRNRNDFMYEYGFANCYREILSKHEAGIRGYSELAYLYTDIGRIAIEDINGDDIPELIFLSAEENEYGYRYAAGLYIWTYDDGAAKLLLYIENFEIIVASGTRFCVAASKSGDLFIHSNIGDESWWDTYSIYKTNKSNIECETALNIKAGFYYNNEADSTYTTDEYIFSAKKTTALGTSDATIDECKAIVGKMAQDIDEVIINNYIPQEENGLAYKALKLVDKSFSVNNGDAKRVKNYTYDEAIRYLGEQYGALGTVDIPCENNKPISFIWDGKVFNTPSNVYNKELALVSCALSEMAYGDEGRIVDTYHAMGFKDEYISLYSYPDNQLNRNDVAGMVSNDKDLAFSIAYQLIDGIPLMIITLRGTNSIGDLIKDVSEATAYGSFYGAEAYKGFLDYFHDVQVGWRDYWDNHPEIITNTLRNDLRILVTGHSLGGACANLVGAWMNSNVFNAADKNNCYIYTFASPNTYFDSDNKMDVGACDNVFNIANEWDIMPYIPVSALTTSDNHIVPVVISQSYIKYGKTLWFKNNKENPAQKLELSKYWNPVDYGIDHASTVLEQHDCKRYLRTVATGKVEDIDKVQWIEISCPVDVELVDAQGNTVSIITNNQADYDNSIVPAYVANETKVLIIPDEENYTLRLRGYDEGTMFVRIYEKSTKTGESTEIKTFENVTLYDGKVMTSEVSRALASDSLRLFVLDEEGKAVKEIQPDGTEKDLLSHSYLNVVFGILAITAIAIVVILLIMSKRRSANRDKSMTTKGGNPMKGISHHCIYCGAELIHGAVFCTQCGKKQ